MSTPSFRTGRGQPRRHGRRVTRIVRRIELWSVLKIALVFNTIMLGVALGTVALLWGLANTTGLVDDLEGFLRDAGFEDFRFRGDQMFEQVAFIGAVGALASTVFMVLSAALLNLISEITGGIRFVVIEEIVDTPADAAPAQPPVPLPTAPPAAPPTGWAAEPSRPSERESPRPAGPGPETSGSPRLEKERAASASSPAEPSSRSSSKPASAKPAPRSRSGGSGNRSGGPASRSGGSGSRLRGGRRPPAAPLRPAADADDRDHRPEAAS